MSVIGSILKWPDALSTDLRLLELDKARLAREDAAKKAAPTPVWTGTPKPAQTPDSNAANKNAAKKFAETPEIVCDGSPCIIP